MPHRITSVLFIALLSGCYLATELCQPEEVGQTVRYLGRTCPEPLHALIPSGAVRGAREIWESVSLTGCEVARDPDVIGHSFGFRLEMRETFPDTPCFSGHDDDPVCVRSFDRYFEIVFVDEATGLDTCSERWGLFSRDL